MRQRAPIRTEKSYETLLLQVGIDAGARHSQRCQCIAVGRHHPQRVWLEEARNFLLPIVEKRDRCHDEGRRQRGIALMRPCDERQQLQGLAEPHVVRQQHAAAVLRRYLEEVLHSVDAGDLVLSQLDILAERARPFHWPGASGKMLLARLPMLDRIDVALDQQRGAHFPRPLPLDGGLGGRRCESLLEGRDRRLHLIERQRRGAARELAPASLASAIACLTPGRASAVRGSVMSSFAPCGRNLTSASRFELNQPSASLFLTM